MAQQDDAQVAHMWRLAGRTSAAGTELACCVALPVALGAWLDARYGWGTVATLIGFGVGLGAAVVSLRRIMRAARARLSAPPPAPGPPA